MSYREELASKWLELFIRWRNESHSAQEQMLVEELLRRKGLSNFVLNERRGERQDKPDVVVTSDKKVVAAIEVTRFLFPEKDGNIQYQIISDWTKFAQELCGRLVKVEKDYFYGAVFLNEKWRYRHIPREIQAQLQQDIVQEIQFLTDASGEIDVSSKHQSILAQYVDKIYYLNTSPERGILWWRSDLQSGCIYKTRQQSKKEQHSERECKPQQQGEDQQRIESVQHGIEDVILNKIVCSNKGYDWMGANERWLLIYAEGFGLHDILPADGVDIARMADGKPFTRIFLWNWWGDTLREYSGTPNEVDS